MGLPAPRRSLSSSLPGLTVLIVLATALLVFLPGLMRERRDWLAGRLTRAHVAALAIAAAPGGQVDAATRGQLLGLTGAASIRVSDPRHGVLTLDDGSGAAPEAGADLRSEGTLAALSRALEELLRARDRLIRVVGPSRMQPDATVEMVMPERGLSANLRDYARQSAEVAATIAVVTGAIVYLALLRLLVRPMRRLTRGIADFRADPEHAAPIGVAGAALGGDEMETAGIELAAMQSELRAALSRNARLAALGAAMAQVSHDLRGILSPAMLVADSLREHPEPAVRRGGETIARVVDRAAALARGMLDFAREGPGPASRRPLALAALVDEAIELLSESAAGCVIVNAVPDALTVQADPDQLLRALINLARNACEAGAARLSITAAALPAGQGRAAMVGLDLRDDGPGLPEQVRATLFRPFSSSTKPGGSGLGLAISRDLVRAQGGELELSGTGAEGTAFRVRLPAAEGALAGARMSA